MPESHATVSPSASKKWLVCTKSVQMESLVPNQDTTYTQEGTLAHSICEKLLKGEDIGACDNDMLRYCTDYKDYCQEQVSKLKNPEVYIETRLDLSSYIPDGFGTADFMAVSECKLILIDFKYGKGVEVSAQENTQLMIYALGALDMFDFIYNIQEVEMHIYQPRLDNIDVYTTSVENLKSFGDIVLERSRMAHTGVGECVAGNHCMEGFCRARGYCRAFSEYNLQLEEFGFADKNLLTSKELGKIIQRAETLESWVKSVKDYALSLMLGGGKIEGFKLVRGRSRRIITNDDKAIEILTQNGYKGITTTKLKGITELEKIVGKKEFSNIMGDTVQKIEGSPTLVPVSDKRAEYVVNSAEVDFANIE